MIETFEDLSKSPFAYLVNNLKSEANLIIFRDSVVSITVIITVVYYSFRFCGMYLIFVLRQVIDFFEFRYFLHLWFRQVLRIVLSGWARRKWILNACISNLTHFLHSKFISFRCFRYNLALFLIHFITLLLLLILIVILFLLIFRDVYRTINWLPGAII